MPGQREGTGGRRTSTGHGHQRHHRRSAARHHPGRGVVRVRSSAAVAAVAAILPGATIDHDDAGDCLLIPRGNGAAVAYLTPCPRRWSYQATELGPIITSLTLRARSAPCDVVTWITGVAA